MSDSKRRHFTPEQKAQVVRRHLSGKEPVSALAEELGVQPSQIHAWVNQVLAQAEKAFENPRKTAASEPSKPRTAGSNNSRPSSPRRTRSSPS